VENVEDHTITFAVTEHQERQNRTLRTMISRDPDRVVVTVDDEQVFLLGATVGVALRG
jgi:hypothetical protein